MSVAGKASTSATRVAVFGTGLVGSAVIRGIGETDGLELVGACVTTPEKVGRDAGELAGIDKIGIAATDDLDGLLARDDVDAVIHCGLGNAEEVAAFLGRCADAGKDAVTVMGLIEASSSIGEVAADALNDRARSAGARLVGAGVNPGFLLDTFPALCATLYTSFDHLYAGRFSDMRHWGHGVLRELGIGQLPEDARKIMIPSVAESLSMVASSLGLRLDERSDIRDVIVAEDRREANGFVVEPGQTLGFKRVSTGSVDGREVLRAEWTGVFKMKPADGMEVGTLLLIKGTPDTKVLMTMEGDDYPTAAARAINSLVVLQTLEPGLYRPDQLPISRYLLRGSRGHHVD